jgi:hypothetical protein
VTVEPNNYTSEKVLVLCRAIPEESKKYSETVCVAGITDKKEFRRLYPIKFTPLTQGGGIPFGKKNWIQVSTSLPEDGRDKRPESRKINMKLVKVLQKITDEELVSYIQPLVSPSISSIEKSGASLGLIKPKILDYNIDIEDTSLFDKQLGIAPNGSSFKKGKIKLDQESSYSFVCEKQSDCSCKNKPHNLRILDWEVNELFRNVVKNTTNQVDIRLKMKAKMLNWMKNERSPYFMVGTHHRWKTWMVVSFLYPPKRLGASLEEFIDAG